MILSILKLLGLAAVLTIVLWLIIFVWLWHPSETTELTITVSFCMGWVAGLLAFIIGTTRGWFD